MASTQPMAAVFINKPIFVPNQSNYKIFVAKKETYFSKHKQKLDLLQPAAFSRQYDATPEQQLEFAAGKVLLIDKPLHWTSFDVVRKIRNSIRIKKVGHAGTLDPLATGLLIVCTGKFTKEINNYMAQEKEYTGTITLGATTPTYDLESEPENKRSFEGITLEKGKEAAQTFVGDIEQFPPIYSAIKKDGEALYKLARRGEDVELKARPIHIESFDLLSLEDGVFSFKVVCGTGTYIRSLAHDLGQVLGCGAYLSALRRTRIGESKAEDALNIEDFLAQFPVNENPRKHTRSQKSG